MDIKKREKITRIIFLLVAVFVAVPLFVNINFTIKPSDPVIKFYNFVEDMKPGSVILLNFDYTPDTMAELNPMARTIISHAFSRDIRVIGLAWLNPSGAGLGQNIMADIGDEYDKEYGKDYVYFGYKVGPVYIEMAKDIVTAVGGTDYRGADLNQMDLFKDTKNYDDIGLVVSLAGSGRIDTWIMYAGTRANRPIAGGLTAVMAADYYPFLASGQLIGLLNGMRGAADYEELINKDGLGKSGMRSQVSAHILILALIIIGNIGYFRSQKVKGEELS